MDNINDRWKIHKNPKKSGCPLLQRAIAKYGLKNFKFEVIIICFNQDLNRFEIEYIKKYKSLKPNGYNIQPGGEYYILNEKPVYQYTLDGKFIKEFKSRVDASKETKDSVDSIIACANLRQKTTLNYIWKNYKVENLFETYKYIYQYDFNAKLINTYVSLQEAIKKSNVSKTKIFLCLEKICNYGGNYFWSYEKVEKVPQSEPRKGSGTPKIVNMYDKDKQLIKRFLSVLDIQKEMNIPKSTMCYYLTKNKYGEFLYKNYFWKEEKLQD